MMKKLSMESVMIIGFVIISTVLDYVLAGPKEYVTLLSPAIGIMTTFYFVKGKKVLLPTLLTYGLTVLITRAYFYTEPFGILLLASLSKVIIMAFMMLLFRYIMYRIPNNGYQVMNLVDVVNYILVGIVVTFLGATLNYVPILLLFDYELPMFWYGNTFIGFLFGFFIFGSSLNFSLVYDKLENVTKRKVFYVTLYMAAASTITIYIFSGQITFINFHDFTYVFLFIYIIAALIFRYIVVFFLNVMMLFFYSIFLFEHNLELDLSTELFTIILIILSLTAATSIIKIYIILMQRKEVENEKINATLNELILSTNEMLTQGNAIAESSEVRSIEFLKRLFGVGRNIFKKYNMASCYVIDNDYVRYISVDGYDIDFLNDMGAPADSFDFTLSKPKIVRSDKELYSYESFKSNVYTEKYPAMKESMRFTIFYDSKPIAGMAFDIVEGNPETYNEEDLHFAEQYQSLINSYFNVNETFKRNAALRGDIVMSLVRALGLFDSYTGVHSEEVAFLSLEIAKKLKLGPEQTDRIYWAAIVHDIGKLGIKESILQKKGKLTKEEKSLVEDHTIKGYEILNTTKDLKDIAVRVKYHHERWDGLGYPEGLKGSEIPICSQVIAISDTVSAMFKDRVYSKARSPEEIVEELKLQKGKQFSPLVTNCMIEYIEETKLKPLKKMS